MNLDKKLEQNGIFPDEELKVDKKIEIAKFVAQGLSDNFKEFADMYNEFYMRIYNCKFYYAQIDSKFNGVFYYYKNNAIYISKDKQIDEYLVHEVIHYIQNFSKVQGNEKKAGLCEFEDYRILALGINEAMVQYITSKIMGEEVLRRNFGSMSVMTNSPDRYKFLASLAYQITYFIILLKYTVYNISCTSKYICETFSLFNCGLLFSSNISSNFLSIFSV